MDIKTNILKKILAGPFGFNISSQNLLENSSSQSNEKDTDEKSLEQIDEELKFRTGRRLIAEEVNKQKNMEDVIQMTDEILQKDPDFKNASINDEDNDPEWIQECLNGAGKTYNHDLKLYFAKLLAGEIKNPGKYSKRAINFMRSISQKDAEKIRNMCQYVMYDFNTDEAFILRYKNAEYSFKDTSFLMELRLLNTSNLVVKQFRAEQPYNQGFFFHKDVGYLIDIKAKEYNLPIFSFSELGKEILSIIDDVEVNIDYLKNYTKSITNNRADIFVVGGQYELDGELIHFQNNTMYFEIPQKDNSNIERD